LDHGGKSNRNDHHRASFPRCKYMTDGQSTKAPPAASARTRLLRRLAGLSVRFGILAIAAVISVVFALRWDSWVGRRIAQTTDDAYVRADLTPLSAKIEGYVRNVAVNDFQHVKAGNLLVQIEDDDYKARVVQAEAAVAGAEAAIQNLKSHKAQQRAEIAQAEDAVIATQADVERTQLEEARQRQLVTSTYGTQQRLEQAVADEKRLKANLLRTQDELDGQRRQLAVLDTQESQLRADLRAKQATLDLAKITLGYTKIVAPVDGVVGERGVRAGQYVRPGVQVISVVPLDSVWVVANYKETQLTHVAPGQRATITVDSFPGTTIEGFVDSLSPASGSQFSLLPPDNATGNFTKVVQRIPVKVRLKPGHALTGRLRPGMSVIVTIHTDSVPTPP
jgi:membrane fusion protein (multidrug efflux system)